MRAARRSEPPRQEAKQTNGSQGHKLNPQVGTQDYWENMALGNPESGPSTSRKPIGRDLVQMISADELLVEARHRSELQKTMDQREYKAHLIGRLKMHNKLKKFLDASQKIELLHHEKDAQYLVSLVEKEDYENLSSALIHVLLVILDRGVSTHSTHGGNKVPMFPSQYLEERHGTKDHTRKSLMNFLDDQNSRQSSAEKSHHRSKAVSRQEPKQPRPVQSKPSQPQKPSVVLPPKTVEVPISNQPFSQPHQSERDLYSLSEEEEEKAGTKWEGIRMNGYDGDSNGDRDEEVQEGTEEEEGTGEEEEEDEVHVDADFDQDEERENEGEVEEEMFQDEDEVIQEVQDEQTSEEYQAGERSKPNLKHLRSSSYRQLKSASGDIDLEDYTESNSVSDNRSNKKVPTPRNKDVPSQQVADEEEHADEFKETKAIDPSFKGSLSQREVSAPSSRRKSTEEIQEATFRQKSPLRGQSSVEQKQSDQGSDHHGDEDLGKLSPTFGRSYDSKVHKGNSFALQSLHAKGDSGSEIFKGSNSKDKRDAGASLSPPMSQTDKDASNPSVPGFRKPPNRNADQLNKEKHKDQPSIKVTIKDRQVGSFKSSSIDSANRAVASRKQPTLDKMFTFNELGQTPKSMVQEGTKMTLFPSTKKKSRNASLDEARKVKDSGSKVKESVETIKMVPTNDFSANGIRGDLFRIEGENSSPISGERETTRDKEDPTMAVTDKKSGKQVTDKNERAPPTISRSLVKSFMAERKTFDKKPVDRFAVSSASKDKDSKSATSVISKKTPFTKKPVAQVIEVSTDNNKTSFLSKLDKSGSQKVSSSVAALPSIKLKDKSVGLFEKDSKILKTSTSEEKWPKFDVKIDKKPETRSSVPKKPIEPLKKSTELKALKEQPLWKAESLKVFPPQKEQFFKAPADVIVKKVETKNLSTSKPKELQKLPEIPKMSSMSSASDLFKDTKKDRPASSTNVTRDSKSKAKVSTLKTQESGVETLFGKPSTKTGISPYGIDKRSDIFMKSKGSKNRITEEAQSSSRSKLSNRKSQSSEKMRQATAIKDKPAPQPREAFNVSNIVINTRNESFEKDEELTKLNKILRESFKQAEDNKELEGFELDLERMKSDQTYQSPMLKGESLMEKSKDQKKSPVQKPDMRIDLRSIKKQALTSPKEENVQIPSKDSQSNHQISSQRKNKPKNIANNGQKTLAEIFSQPSLKPLASAPKQKGTKVTSKTQATIPNAHLTNSKTLVSLERTITANNSSQPVFPSIDKLPPAENSKDKKQTVVTKPAKPSTYLNFKEFPKSRSISKTPSKALSTINKPKALSSVSVPKSVSALSQQKPNRLSFTNTKSVSILKKPNAQQSSLFSKPAELPKPKAQVMFKLDQPKSSDLKSVASAKKPQSASGLTKPKAQSQVLFKVDKPKSVVSQSKSATPGLFSKPKSVTSLTRPKTSSLFKVDKPNSTVSPQRPVTVSPSPLKPIPSSEIKKKTSPSTLFKEKSKLAISKPLSVRELSKPKSSTLFKLDKPKTSVIFKADKPKSTSSKPAIIPAKAKSIASLSNPKSSVPVKSIPKEKTTSLSVRPKSTQSALFKPLKTPLNKPVVSKIPTLAKIPKIQIDKKPIGQPGIAKTSVKPSTVMASSRSALSGKLPSVSRPGSTSVNKSPLVKKSLSTRNHQTSSLSKLFESPKKAAVDRPKSSLQVNKSQPLLQIKEEITAKKEVPTVTKISTRAPIVEEKKQTPRTLLKPNKSTQSQARSLSSTKPKTRTGVAESFFKLPNQEQPTPSRRKEEVMKPKDSLNTQMKPMKQNQNISLPANVQTPTRKTQDKAKESPAPSKVNNVIVKEPLKELIPKNLNQPSEKEKRSKPASKEVKPTANKKAAPWRDEPKTLFAKVPGNKDNAKSGIPKQPSAVQKETVQSKNEPKVIGKSQPQVIKEEFKDIKPKTSKEVPMVESKSFIAVKSSHPSKQKDQERRVKELSPTPANKSTAKSDEKKVQVQGKAESARPVQKDLPNSKEIQRDRRAPSITGSVSKSATKSPDIGLRARSKGYEVEDKILEEIGREDDSSPHTKRGNERQTQDSKGSRLQQTQSTGKKSTKIDLSVPTKAFLSPSKIKASLKSGRSGKYGQKEAQLLPEPDFSQEMDSPHIDKELEDHVGLDQSSILHYPDQSIGDYSALKHKLRAFSHRGGVQPYQSKKSSRNTSVDIMNALNSFHYDPEKDESRQEKPERAQPKEGSSIRQRSNIRVHVCPPEEGRDNSLVHLSGTKSPGGKNELSFCSVNKTGNKLTEEDYSMISMICSNPNDPIEFSAHYTGNIGGKTKPWSKRHFPEKDQSRITNQ